ncbi:MAG: alpha/beta hydrolase [Clostridiales bacterium]|jgi:pimeloyl-ACP methyl ester carboxylesterase|nr:alpha/beta hydrolase [Clostridiales bacterium]
MRKSTKLLLGIGAAIATPIAINYVIAKKAEARIKKAQEAALPPYEQLEYEWEYGNIRYTKTGEGKPPLLLLHGIYPGASGLEWDLAIEWFAEDYTVYVPDLLGFGYSSKPALDFCSYLFVRLIKDFAENVIGQPTTAIASLHTAAALVSCASLNPQDFEKIVLVSPTGLETETILAQDEDGMLKKVLESPVAGTSFYNAICSKKALAQFYAKEGLVNADFFDEAYMDKVYLAAHADRASGKYALAALLGKFFNTDIKETLANLEVPYSIIVGEPQCAGASFKIYNGMDESYDAHVVEFAGLLPHTENGGKFYDLVKSL